MRTITVALLAFAAAPVVWAQDVNAPVTLKTTGMSVADVVAKLRAATKADLQAPGLVGNEVVLVDVDQVPAKDLMEKLALAVGGEWAKSDSLYQLVVRDTSLRKAVNQRVAMDAMAVKKAVAKMIEQIKPDEPFAVPSSSGGPQILSPEGGAQVFLNSGGSTAGQKQLAKLIQAISPQTLASIGPGARTVFSNSPYGVQQPLPGNADQLIRAALADELKAAESGNAGRAQVVIGADKVDHSIERLRRGVYGKAYLVVRRNGWDPNFVCTLTVVDPNGERLLGATTMLSENGVPQYSFIIAGDNDLEISGGAPTPDKPSQPADDGKDIVLSEEAQNLAKIAPGAVNTFGVTDMVFVSVSLDGGEAITSDGGGAKLTAGAAAALMVDPVAHEPLSYFVGEAVRQVMPEDKPVVALLSDELFSQMRPMMAGTAKTGQVAKMLVKAGYEFIDKDGWQVAKPLDIDRCQRHRVDRKAFKSFLDSAKAIGAAPLASVANYAMTSPDTNSNLWDVMYAGALYGNAVSSEVSDTRGQKREALRIYAGLSDVQRKANGRNMSLSAVSNREINDLVFKSNDGPKPWKNNSQRPTNLSVAVTSSFPNPEIPNANDLFGPAFERTDVFVGVPPQTNLLVDGNDETVLRVFDPKTGQSQLLTPDAIGNYKAMGEQTWGRQIGSTVGDNMKVQVLARRRVSMTVGFAGRYQMVRSLSDYAPVPQSKLVAWNELPVEVQDQIAASYKRSADMYKNSQFEVAGQGSRVRPPQ